MFRRFSAVKSIAVADRSRAVEGLSPESGSCSSIRASRMISNLIGSPSTSSTVLMPY